MNHNHNDGLFIFIAFFLLPIDVHLSELPPVVEPEADGAHGGDEDDDDCDHPHHRRQHRVRAPLVLGSHPTLNILHHFISFVGRLYFDCDY